MLQKMRRTNQKGFTLIELMIVIAIIGILSAIAIPNFLSYRAKGQDSAAKSEASNFYVAAMAEAADLGVTKTYSDAGLPAGFAKNPDIDYGSSIVYTSDDGTTVGNMTFSHNKSSTSYKLVGPTGSVIVVP